MKEHPEVALGGIVAGGRGSTFECSAVIERPARHTFCAGRVRKEMQRRLENSTVEYGR